jgi:hypothetical protein
MSADLFEARLLTPEIVEVVLGKNVYLDISVTDKIDQALHRLAPDRKLYQMVIANGPYIVNPEMRTAMSKGDAGIKLKGIAWVSPDEKGNQEQESIVSKLPIPIPLRFFSDRNLAFEWLKTLSAGH